MSKPDIELTFRRPVPPPRPPRTFERFSRIITRNIPERTFERFSRIMTRNVPERNLNEELGDINYDPMNRLTFSPSVVILVVSLIINIVCVGVFLYQTLSSTHDDLKLEEQCVLKKLIRNEYVKIYNTDIFQEESGNTCDLPLQRARKYVDDKIKILRQKELSKTDENDDFEEEDHDRLNEKIDITDLVMITQYFDKMFDGPRGCMASNCTILENRRRDQTSILCDFNYKAKFKDF